MDTNEEDINAIPKTSLKEQNSPTRNTPSGLPVPERTGDGGNNEGDLRTSTPVVLPSTPLGDGGKYTASTPVVLPNTPSALPVPEQTGDGGNNEGDLRTSTPVVLPNTPLGDGGSDVHNLPNTSPHIPRNTPSGDGGNNEGALLNTPSGDGGKAKLAIIGTGIAGMGCAHLLQHKYNLTIFEKDNYVGGHTNTITVDEDGTPVYMDTGFMVFNYQTYPNLCKLFEEIKAPVKKTDMSFSVQHVPSGLEYCGSGLGGLFAQRKNIFSPRYIKMLMQVSRFNKESIKALDNPEYENYSIKQFIDKFGFGEDMLWKYLVPMSAAVWSTPMDKMLDFPALTLIRFFKNHGFLGLNTQHQWYTLQDGSQSYRKILIEPFKHRIQTGNGAVKVARQDGKAIVYTVDGNRHVFDKVIFACHGDQALKLLDNPTALEQNLLSTFKYQENIATVHTDEAIMPKHKKVWSSWNYRIEERNGKQLPTTIYWMNRLQGVSEKKNYFVSIGALPGSIDKKKIIQKIMYQHPLFDVAAIQAQQSLHKLNEQGPLYYCGSYFKYGFHEDAYASAVGLCKLL